MSSIPNSPLKLDLPARVTLAQQLISTVVATDPKVVQARQDYRIANQDYVSRANQSGLAYFGAFATVAIDALLVGTGAIATGIAGPALIIPAALVYLGIHLGARVGPAKILADKAEAASRTTAADVRATFNVETEAKRFE